MKPTLAHIFLNSDMRCSHDGLKAQIKKKRIKIGESDFIIFLNNRRTILKCFLGTLDALIHIKKADNRPIDLGAIKYIPKYCNGPELDIDAAQAEHLTEVLKRGRR